MFVPSLPYQSRKTCIRAELVEIMPTLHVAIRCGGAVDASSISGAFRFRGGTPDPELRGTLVNASLTSSEGCSRLMPASCWAT